MNQFFVYLDELIIIANSFEQLMGRLKTVLGRLRAPNLKLNGSKCELFKRKVSFLGYVITRSHGSARVL